MANKAVLLGEVYCCCVCRDIFKDPVVLGCSHSFCRVCLQKSWEEKSSRECPICRRKSSKVTPPSNLALKNIVELCLKQKTWSESVEESEGVQKGDDPCIFHGEKLTLFCEEDQQALCAVCQTLEKHRNHHLCPVEEAARNLKEELQTVLNPIKEKLERFTKVKQECEKTAEHIRNHLQSQAQHTEMQIKAEFEKLHQFLRDEEEARLAALKEGEEQRSQMLMEKMEDITRQIFILAEKITAIEKTMEIEDIPFLKTFKDTKKRAQCTLQDPELLSGVLIDVAKHLGNLKFRVWEKMLGTVQYTPVTLDPNTAASKLCLSDDLTWVTNTEIAQSLPDNQERFDSYPMVLGSQGFTSGKHSWEVEVGNKPKWTIGVVKESINRKGRISCSPETGFWVLTMRNGDEYKAAGIKSLNLKMKPQRIRVQLDYDRGEVSFHDPSDMTHIYTFKDSFTERLYPFFSPCSNEDGSNPGALQICSVNVSVKADLSGFCSYDVVRGMSIGVADGGRAADISLTK